MIEFYYNVIATYKKLNQFFKKAKNKIFIVFLSTRVVLLAR